MDNLVEITRVEFENFKAFPHFSVSLGKLNVLVGPNNSGKSTILSALSCARGRFSNELALRSADSLMGHAGYTYGHIVPTRDLPISLENAHTNYETVNNSSITFYLSNGNHLDLWFPPEGGAILIPWEGSRPVRSPSSFRTAFPIRIEAVPVLGPLEHRERIVEEQTVREGLMSHRASRHFRNYWRYYPENFDAFRDMICRTWPGMDIGEPERADYEFLVMFFKEGRLEREMYWAGFGFQVWCQLLTHIVRSREATILVVDEPEIYLHPDLQRKLLAMLRNAGPDVIMATHSTEIVSESDPAEILIIDKTKRVAQRVKNTDQVQQALNILGSNQNITLTQLARTQRVFFVEGVDFKIIGRFAQQIGLTDLASKFDFTVVPVGGFSQWENVKAFAWGVEKTLGIPLMLGAVFDRDYRCDEDVSAIEQELARHLMVSHVHQRKELENYLLIPKVIDRAIRTRLSDQARRRGEKTPTIASANELLDEITIPLRPDVLSQYIKHRTEFVKQKGLDISNVTADAIRIFETKWSDIETRMEIVPGKEVFSALNRFLGDNYHISLTPTLVISQFIADEIPRDMVLLLKRMEKFRNMQL